MNCCVFTNEKGGVGKTTVVSILALTLARRGKKVLVIDTDGQCNASMVILHQKNAENNLYDVLINDVPAKDCIHHVKGLDIIPAHYELKNLDARLLTDPKKRLSAPTLLEQAIRPIKDDYDYILVDTPPTGGMILVNAFMLADRVIVPAVPEGFAYAGFADLFSTLQSVQNHRNNGLPVLEGILFTRVRKQTTLHQEGLGFVQEEYEGIQVFETSIRDSILIPTTQIMGVTPQEMDKRARVTQDCEEFVDEFEARMEGRPYTPTAALTQNSSGNEASLHEQ